MFLQEKIEMRWYPSMIQHRLIAFPMSILTTLRAAMHTMRRQPRRFTHTPSVQSTGSRADGAGEACSYKKPYLRGSVPRVIPSNNFQNLSPVTSMIRVNHRDSPGHGRSREGSVEAVRHESYLGVWTVGGSSAISRNAVLNSRIS